MQEAVIVEAVRTPLGRRNGKLKDWHPVELLAFTLNKAVERAKIDPAEVEDVIAGCVSQAGEQGVNIARNAVIAAGWPVEVPGTTVDRQCGSSQQAIHFAAQGVISGNYDLVVACGVESMTRQPMGSNMQGGGFPFTDSMTKRFPFVPQGVSAEMIAEKWGVSREEVDRVGYRSQVLAQKATAEGRFDREIAPIEYKAEDGSTQVMKTDEGLRETSLEKLATLKPSFKPEGGVITAGNSSQITDGAAAVVICTPEKAQQLGLRPRARFHAFSVAGDNPTLMLTAPIPATQKVLKRAGLDLSDIDVVEINEAFASVLCAWAKDMGVDEQEILDDQRDNLVNPNGGAIALGHPLGCSGARLMTTLLHELERRGARWGLQTMCEGGGLANATVIERLG